MSISSAARFTPAKGRSDNRFGIADERHDRPVGRLARVHVEQFDAPEASMAAVICRITALSRPSLKLGTHSMIRLGHRIVAFKFLYFKDK